MTAALSVQVGLVQVRAQQREQRPVAVGEVRPGPAEEEQPQGPARPRGRAGRGGQGQHQVVLEPLRPVDVAIGAAVLAATFAVLVYRAWTARRRPATAAA